MRAIIRARATRALDQYETGRSARRAQGREKDEAATLSPRVVHHGGLRRHRDFDGLLQLTVLVLLDHDVATADELSVQVELRDRRPV